MLLTLLGSISLFYAAVNTPAVGIISQANKKADHNVGLYGEFCTSDFRLKL